MPVSWSAPAWGSAYRGQTLDAVAAAAAAQERGKKNLLLQTQQSGQIAAQIAAAQRESALAQAAATQATGGSTRAGLMVLAGQGASIGGQAATQAAKDRLQAQQAYQKAISQQIQGYLGAEKESLAGMNLAAQDYWNQLGLGNEYLKQLAKQKERWAQAEQQQKQQEYAVYSGLLGAAGNVAGSMGTSSGGGTSGGSSGGTTSGYDAGYMSDRRAKTDAKTSGKDVDHFLQALKAYRYRYRDKVRGLAGVSPGVHVGVMAQDLERSKTGRRFVHEADDGYKRVDYGRMAPTMLASLARLDERMRRIERR